MARGKSVRRFVCEQLAVDGAVRRGLTPVNWFLLFLILFSLVLYTAETTCSARNA